MVRCAACGTVGASQRCGACRYAQYCNAVCQRGHWKAGHKQECKSICAAIPLSAEGLRRLSLPGLVDFICSPGVLVGDATRLAASLVVDCHRKQPLSKELSMRVTTGFLDVVERLHEERIALIEAPCCAIFAVIDPDFFNIFFDEGGMLVVIRALRTAVGCASSRADTPAEVDTATGAPSVHIGDSAIVGTMTELYIVIRWLLYIVERLIGKSSDDRATRLLVDNDALPLVVAVVRKCSSDMEDVLESGCEIIAAVATLNKDCRSTLVAAGAVPALLQVILQSGRLAPTYVFAALSNVLEPHDVEHLDRAVIAEAVHDHLAHIVDATFCMLTCLFDFDKDSKNDVAMLTHAGRLVASLQFYTSPDHDHGRSTSTVLPLSVLMFGDGKPDRFPALVNALRATIHGIAGIVKLEYLAGAFASAIAFAIDGAGLASCRAAVEAGAIPALLAALRKLGKSCFVLVYSSSVALHKLQLSARDGCCSERIASELSMRGTTPKLLRRLRDVWRAKVDASAAAEAAANADFDAENAKGEGRLSELAVNGLSILLADIVGLV